MIGNTKWQLTWIPLLAIAWTAGCSGEGEVQGKSGLGPLESVVFQGTEDGWSGQLDNGTYRLHNPGEAGGIRYFYTPFQGNEAGDRAMGVDVRIEDGGDGSGRAGLLYGYRKSPLSYFMILASAAGDVEVYRRDSQGVNLTMATSTDPKNDFLRLELVEKGREVRVVADGETINTFQSQGTGSGALGIAAMGLGHFEFTNYMQNQGGSTAQARATQKKEQQTARNSKGKSEILRLKRFEIIDREGFGEPVVAISFLAPADWQLEGGVTWNVNAPCVFDLTSIQARVRDPQGRRSFEIFPKYTSEWVQEPTTNQMMARSQPCRNAPPLTSPEFISRMFVPGFRSGARVLGTEPRPAAANAMREKVVAIEGADMARYRTDLRVDAAQAHIAYDSESGGAEEWVLATSTITSMPVPSPITGGETRREMTFVDNVLGFKTPAGELQANERLFGAILASYRVNPGYERAVRNVIFKVGETQTAGQMARIQSLRNQSRRIFQDWNASIDQRDADWKRRNAAQDQVNRQFTEAIRGTQTFADPHDSGTAWELTNDYEYVWKTATDEFILTNDINYNPNEDLNSSDWQQMRATR